MENLLEEGKCKSIGVSNFTKKHLEELIKDSDITPAVNQVEFSPYLYQEELLEFCRSKNIQLEAYSPLTRGKKLSDPKLMDCEVVAEHPWSVPTINCMVYCPESV